MTADVDRRDANRARSRIRLDRARRIAQRIACVRRGASPRSAPYALAEQLWQVGGLREHLHFGRAGSRVLGARTPAPARHAAVLERYAASIGGLSEAQAFDDAYRAMTPASFSREVLANAPSLAVLPGHRHGNRVERLGLASAGVREPRRHAEPRPLGRANPRRLHVPVQRDATAFDVDLQPVGIAFGMTCECVLDRRAELRWLDAVEKVIREHQIRPWLAREAEDYLARASAAQMRRRAGGRRYIRRNALRRRRTLWRNDEHSVRLRTLRRGGGLFVPSPACPTRRACKLDKLADIDRLHQTSTFDWVER